MLMAEVKDRIKLFENRSFLFFTLSGLFATLGNGLNYIALSWLAYNQSGSIGGVALMMFFIWMPGIVFAPLFGFLADRYNRKAQIMLSNLVRGVAIMGFVLCWHWGIEIELMLLCAVLGIFVAFYMPAAIPFIQSIVPRKKLVSANATIDMVYELGTIIGMGISGGLIALLDMKWTLGTGGVLFVLAGLCNLAMGSSGSITAPAGGRQSWYQEYASSLRYFIRTPLLFMPYLTQMIIMVLVMTIPIILLPYSQQILQTDSRTFALYEVVFSIGVLTGSFFSPILCAKITARHTLAVLLLLLAAGLSFLSQNHSVMLVFPVYFLIGFGLSGWALSISLSQLHCHPDYQGRLQATFNGCSGMFILAIYLLMAQQEQRLSVQTLYLLLSLLALLGIAIVLFFRQHSEAAK